MSKKMMKRSLALGALMAFVITGNVWAGDITTQAQADQINNKSGTVTIAGSIIATNSVEDITVMGIADNTILDFDNGGLVIKRKDEIREIRVDSVKELNITTTTNNVIDTSDNTHSTAGIWNGDGDGDGSKHTGKIIIGNKVSDVTVTSSDIGIYCGGETALVQIESNNLVVNAGGYGVMTNSQGTINIGTKEKQLDRVVINAALNESSNALGIYASGSVSHVNVLANDIEINSYGGLMARQGDISLGAKDNIAENIKITTKSHAVDVRFGNLAELYGENITIDSKTGYALVSGVESGGDINVTASQKLDIKGNIKNLATSSDRGIFEFNINKDVTDAIVTINGNIETGNTGKVNLNLGTKDSSLTGTVTDNNSGINLNLNKGTWNVTGKSTVDTVSGDGATIKVDSLQKDYVKVTNGGGASNFTLLGGRKVTDQLDGDNLEGSMEEVSSIVNGIAFANYKFEEGTALGEIEAYQEENGEWKIVERTNVTNSNISDVAALGLMAWRSEMNDMNKRLGELRNANGEHGVWVRMVRGETEYEAVKNQYNTYQLGYDEKLSVDKSWTVGMALSYTDGENSFNGGNGENKHKGLAIYGSKLNNDGSFIDLIAKYARLDHDVEVGTEKGDYEANGYSVSAEYGKRFQQGNGLWVEPQVELTYGKVGSADYMIGKNRAVTHEGMESLVGRVGFSLGKDIKQGNVYARASYLYDFEGETEASYTDAVGNRRYINDDLGGGWWEVGVGANINLSRATYIYADVEKTFGGEVDTNWQWNLGVRYSF